MSSAAELALKKKYALLQKRKQEAAAGGKSGGGSGSAAGSAAAGTTPAAAQDPARLAAIKALQAKRAGSGGAADAAAAAGKPAAKQAATAGSGGSTKLKLVIPKREAHVPGPAAAPQMAAPSQRGTPATAGAGGAAGPAPGDSARAAALAALKAKAEQRQQQQQAAAAAAEAPKRPTVKRPSARPRPLPQQQLQQAAGSAAAAAAAALDGTFGAEHAQLQQQHLEPAAGYYGGEGEEGAGYEQERPAKRQRGEQVAAGSEQQQAEDGATLFVGDLPQFWATAQLYDFFGQFGKVVEARVIGSQCYGFISFETPEEAEGLLEFAQQQGVWAEDRLLRINWAQGSMPEWKKGPAVYRSMEAGEGPAQLEAYEHPRVKEARLQAQQLAASVDAQQIQALAMQPPPERALVSYDDL